MIETYFFTIPSLQDDTPLDCRIYHPTNLLNAFHVPRGAIIAHPYPPLGGTQDDHVVLALTECLLKKGHIVVTFNFRGAGDSAGSNSWTGHGEIQDYHSVVGLLVYYLHHLDLETSNEAADVLSSVLSNQELHLNEELPFENQEASKHHIQLLLGGYSFGSLILVRLPSIASMIHTIETAEQGTSGAEIFLRARELARQTQRTLRETRRPSTPRAHKHSISGSHLSSSPVRIGGEETDPTERRRRSKDLHGRSLSAMREMPHRIRTHIRRHSGSGQHQTETSRESPPRSSIQGTPLVKVRYLLVSPVLFPLSTVPLPPGLSFPKVNATDGNAGVLSLKNPSFLAFGDSDHFTSAKRLRQWGERLAGESDGRWEWTQVIGAGHFWREDGALAQLEAALVKWIQSEMQIG